MLDSYCKLHTLWPVLPRLPLSPNRRVHCFCFLFLWERLKKELCVSDTVPFWPLSVWLVSLSMLPSEFTCVATSGRVSFSLTVENISVYISTTHVLYPFINQGTLSYLPILAIPNNTAMNMGCRPWFQFIWIYTNEWDCWIIR